MKEETPGRTLGKETPGAGGLVFSALVRSDQSVPVVEVRGEIDLATVPRLLEAIGVAGSRMDGRPLLVVDLRETEFLDVTGLRTLLEEARAMRGLGGELRLVVPVDGPVARIFGLLGTERVLDLRHELDLRVGEQAS